MFKKICEDNRRKNDQQFRDLFLRDQNICIGDTEAHKYWPRKSFSKTFFGSLVEKKRENMQCNKKETVFERHIII